MKHTSERVHACCTDPDTSEPHYIFADDDSGRALFGVCINDPDRRSYCEAEGIITVAEAKENAKRVELCWNCHDELLHALKSIYALVQGESPSLLEDNHDGDIVRAVIARAEGGAA